MIDKDPCNGLSIPLSNHVQLLLRDYFKHLDGHPTCNLYKLVISEVEKPLLGTVMEEAAGNQTRAAEILGINRSTLRKKLRQHGMD